MKPNTRDLLLPLIFFVLLILAFGVVIGLKTQKETSTFTSDHLKLLSACTGHAKGNVHTHAYLTITFLGQEQEIPENVGIIDNCIHPVHTHDSTGTIHIDYPGHIPFTLGDFFTQRGILFNRNQLGSIKTPEGYTIKTKVNGKWSNLFQDIVFHDKDKIDIDITKK